MSLQDAANLGTTLAAVATVVLVWFGLKQLSALKKQVEAGQQSSDAAVSAAEAAHLAVREAARARVDEQVARVIVLCERPQWPPLVNSLIPADGQARLFDPMVQHASAPVGREDFIFPEHADHLMWFVVHGIVTNEGRSTARIRLTGEGEFIAGESPLLPGEIIPVPPTASEWRSDRSYLNREHVLRPGQTALFRWAASNTVVDWTADPAEPAPRASVHLEVFDSAVHGVIDRVRLEVRAWPLQAVPRRSEHWALSDTATDVDVIVFPTQRRYLTEEPLPD
ncbi:hypothetical protein QMA61_35070 [Streptomyces coelicoflavus]|uniref:hypothetical protein n=1 Tax=Streptomyces coelicoflavus TaxID=285562 RepID=UPI0024AD6600|nr:hypothetical protein [Streptomyces coelicoflavus]MDI6521407.1 hypothetical protein [Streptomyces coelicoflavus]